ncbi:unnamed protein product, partial [Symbiodinium sp. CCMP2456]
PIDIMAVPLFPATVVGAVPRLILSAEKDREMYQRKVAKQATETMVLPGGGSAEEASKAIQDDGDHVPDSKGEGDGDHVTGSKGEGDADHVADPKGEGNGDHVADPKGEGDHDTFTESDDEAKHPDVTRGDQLSLKSRRKAGNGKGKTTQKAVIRRGKSRKLRKLKSMKKKQTKASADSREWQDWEDSEGGWDGEDWNGWEEEPEIPTKGRAAKSKPGPKPKAKASPKGKAKAKAKAKASAKKDDPAKPKPKAKAKQAAKPKPTKVDCPPEPKRKRGKTAEPAEHRPESVSPTFKQLKDKLLKFVEQHSGRELDAAFKKELRGVCQNPLVNSSLNIYWKRPGCGVTCKALSKDFGYYYFKADGVDFLDRLLLSCKAGQEIVFQIN